MKLYLFLLLFTAGRVVFGQALILTEIFADPTPRRGLPEREYLEIFNRSTAEVTLQGYTLTYGNSRVALPDSVIGPGEYIIVCRQTYFNEFTAFGRVVGVPALSLNNNGNTLRLSGPQGSEEHVVTYSSSWYTPGRTEGYSLEMIDTAYPCRGKNNWQSTVSGEGGTPGKSNSVRRDNPDFTPPELLGYDLRDNRIVLYFNEVLSSRFAENRYCFEVSGATLSEAAFGETHETVLLTLEQAPSGPVELWIYQAEDCSGNTGTDFLLVFEDLPEPLPGDLLLSEVLFNPLAGGDDFVEIYNPTSQDFNLKNWQLARLNAAGEITGHVILSPTHTVLRGNSWMAFCRNPAFLATHYPQTGTVIEVTALPAYNQDTGTVLLLKPDSTVFDQFTYSEKMHAALVINPKGVSLERISFHSGRNEWTSAASDAGFATPGAPNSQWESQAGEPAFTAEPPVFFAGTQYTWLSYRLTGGETYAAIQVIDRHARTVRTLARNYLLGSSGKIAWDGTDDQGALLPPGYYVFVINVFGTAIERTFYAKTAIGLN